VPESKKDISMKAYQAVLPDNSKLTIVTETPENEVPDAIHERFRVYPASVVLIKPNHNSAGSGDHLMGEI
jgi:hypothetical protein